MFRVDDPRWEPRVLYEVTQNKMGEDAESDFAIPFVDENNYSEISAKAKGNVDCQTKINIGVMIMKDGRLSIKRGYSLYDQASVSFQVCS